MKAIFRTVQSDLKQYDGQIVDVGKELDDNERDIEVGRMWHITFSDGVCNDAFEDELEFLGSKV